MKRVFFIVFSLVFAVQSYSQSDQKAADLLEQTSKKMQSFGTMSANFVFTMENERMNINEQNTGTLLLKGDKYQVKLPDLGMQVYSDGATVWNYMEMADQVMITNAGDDSQGGIDPSVIFNIYQEGYTFRFVEEKTQEGRTISYVDLIPADPQAEFKKITVGIDKARLMVSSLITHGNDGNQYGIYVKDINTDKAISDSEFIFDLSKHRDIEVIDFR